MDIIHFKELNDRLQDVYEYTMHNGQDLLKSWFHTVLSQHPEVKTVQWKQFRDTDEDSSFTFSSPVFNLEEGEEDWEGELAEREELAGNSHLQSFVYDFDGLTPVLLDLIFGTWTRVIYTVADNSFRLEDYSW